MEYLNLSSVAKNKAIKWYRKNIEYFGEGLEWSLSNTAIDEILDNCCEYQFDSKGNILTPESEWLTT